jgi:hypothetical protein
VNSFIKWLLFTFAVYGLANAISVLKIGQFIFGIGYCKDKYCVDDGHPKEGRRLLGKIPYLGDLFYCPPCVAFWVGMGMSWLILSPASEVVSLKWQAMVVDGLSASGWVYLIHMTAEKLGHGMDV